MMKLPIADWQLRTGRALSFNRQSDIANWQFLREVTHDETCRLPIGNCELVALCLSIGNRTSPVGNFFGRPHSRGT